MNEHELKAAKDVWKRNNRVRIERDDNLIGVGLGPKERNGRIRDELAVKFYVRKKVKRGELASEDLLEVPDQIADVVQMAPLRAVLRIAASPPTRWLSPLRWIPNRFRCRQFPPAGKCPSGSFCGLCSSQARRSN